MTIIPLSCRYCNAPMRKTRTSRPQGLAACRPCQKSGRDLKHGTGNAYTNHGCRCDACRAHMTETAQRFRDGFEARTGRSWNATYRAAHRAKTGRSLQASPKDWITPKRRLELYERDAWACYLCGDALSLEAPANDPKELTLDHIQPRSKGGSHDSANLKTCCRECNVLKSNHLPEAEGATA